MHLDAATRIEEEEQTPNVADIRRDETKNLAEVVTKLVNQLTIDDKQHKDRQNQSREQSASLRRWRDNKRDGGRQQDRGFSKRRRFLTPGLATGWMFRKA